MSNRVEMEILPKCDFCQSIAEYDTMTRVGSWAYTCPDCYPKWGVDKLGTGYGQKLIKGVK